MKLLNYNFQDKKLTIEIYDYREVKHVIEVNAKNVTKIIVQELAGDDVLTFVYDNHMQVTYDASTTRHKSVNPRDLVDYEKEYDDFYDFMSDYE